jgi:gliding motility-associated-like protein
MNQKFRLLVSLICFVVSGSFCFGQITGIKVVGDTCGVPAELTLQIVGTTSSPYVFWNFGDPASGTNDTITITGSSAATDAVHRYNSAGIYTVCATFAEPGFPPETVCRTFSIGLCCSGVIVAADSCIQNEIAFSLTVVNVVNSVTWDFGDTASGLANTSSLLSPTHSFSLPGSYTVTATLVADCGTFTLTLPLSVVDCDTACVARIAWADSCLANGTLFQALSDSAILTVAWDFGDPASGAANNSNLINPRHDFSDAGTYVIQAIIELGCGLDTVSQTVQVIDCYARPECEVFLGNAFTPNGDGLNDEYLPTINCPTETYALTVFDRWGKRIFYSTSPTVAWDGKYQNADCPEGVYFAAMEIRFQGEKAGQSIRTVTLLR